LPVPFASPPSVAVVGAGPAGLMAAEVLAEGGARVTIYDRMASPGRKFLLAGRGGLNLTHSEPLEVFLTRYSAAAPLLRRAIEDFSPAMLRDWCKGLGQDTFIGSSGRVFPKAFKTSPLLRAWLRRLAAQGVTFAPRHRWIGFAENDGLRFATPAGSFTCMTQAYVFALGGASWAHLGSDGRWMEEFAAAGILANPLQPANCGFLVDWSPTFRDRFEGQPLKTISLSFADHRVRGEAIVTRDGIEGGGIYALSAPLREAVSRKGEAFVSITLRADLDEAELNAKLSAARGKQSLSNVLRKVLKLSPVAIGLLQEAARARSQIPTSMNAAELARLIAAVPLRLTGIAPIGRAISSAGGVSFDEIDQSFMLVRRPGTFLAGEMLDWEAPTGGYLLQASLATGAAAGRGALAWLARRGLDPCE
jgi:uncharacterized flavoprotein (TIGR03862 family)